MRQGLNGTGVVIVEDPDGLLTELTDGGLVNLTLGKTGKIIVPKMEIAPSELLGCPRCLENTVLSLTNSFAPGGVIWNVIPSIPDGATLDGDGESSVFHPGTVGTNYFVTASCVDAPDCVSTSKVTVCVPGPIVVKGDSYIDNDPNNPGESHKVIFHCFYPAPAETEAANHFVFVQHVKGYAKNSDGTYPQVNNMYGLIDTIINFPNYVIDSNSDDDPAYGTYPTEGDIPAIERPGHDKGNNINEYYVVDDVNASDYETGAKTDLQFKIGIYCTHDVPFTGASSNVGVGVPFSENVWLFQFTSTTNGLGEKVFTHP